MSGAIAFDTHRFVKRLTENGFTEQQAETLADEHVALLNANLATKSDVEAARADIADVGARITEVEARIAKVEARITEVEARIAEVEVRIAKVEAGMEALRQEFKAGMEALRQESRASIEAVKADLLKWLFGALIAQGGLIVALVKLL